MIFTDKRLPLLAGGILLLAASTSWTAVRAQNLTSDQLDQVKARLAEGATHRCVRRSYSVPLVMTGGG